MDNSHKTKEDLQAEILELSMQYAALKDSYENLQQQIDIANQEKVNRQKGEAQLAAERKLLRTLVDNLPDYIYVKDTASKYIITNKAHVALWGYAEEELKGKTMVDILGEEIAGTFLEDDRKVFASGNPVIGREEQLMNRQGEKRWLSTTKVALRNEQDEITGLVGISRDITAQKKVEEALKIKNEELKKLSGSLILVREVERKNLAMEVHEELGQLASVIKMDLDWIKMQVPLVEKTVQRIDHAVTTSELLLNSIRRLAAALRPGMLDELGLNAALQWLCAQFTLINNIACVFEQLADDNDVTIGVKTQLYRICEESLTNIKMHATAGYVNVILRNTAEALQLCITDDGVGFDAGKKTKGIGLIVMRERAHSIDGKLTVISSEGKGTSVLADIPFLA